MALSAEISAIARSNSLAESLERGYRMAVDQAHREVTLEHLLFALTDDPEAAVVLAASSVDLNRLRADVSAYLGNLFDDSRASAPADPAPDPDLLRILKAAAEAAQQSRRRQIDGAIVLAALVGDGKSSAAGILRAHGLTFETAIRALQQVNAAANASAARGPAAPRPAPVAPPVAPAEAVLPREPAVAPAPPANPTDDLLASVRARLKKSEAQAPAIELPPRPARKSEPRPVPAAAAPASVWDAVAPAQGAGAVANGATARAFAERSEPAPPRPSVNGIPPSLPPAAPEPAAAAVATSQTGIPAQAAGAAVEPAPQLHPGWAPPSLQRPPQWAQAMPANARDAANGPSAPPSPSLADRILKAGDGPPRPPLPAGAGAMNGHAAPAMAQGPPQMPPQPVPQQGPLQVMPRLNGHGAGNRSPPPPLLDVYARGQPRPREAPPPVAPAVPFEIAPIDAQLPRRMRQLRAVRVEVRVPRASFTEIGVAVPGPDMPLRSDFGLSRAVTLRLASAGRSLAVEARSPETLWIVPGSGTPQDDLAWRWDLTGLRTGRAKVRLVGVVRTISTNGSSSETPLFEQIVDIRVKPRAGRRLAWLATLVLALAAGAASGLLFENYLAPLIEQARQLLVK